MHLFDIGTLSITTVGLIEVFDLYQKIDHQKLTQAILQRAEQLPALQVRQTDEQLMALTQVNQFDLYCRNILALLDLLKEKHGQKLSFELRGKSIVNRLNRLQETLTDQQQKYHATKLKYHRLKNLIEKTQQDYVSFNEFVDQ